MSIFCDRVSEVIFGDGCERLEAYREQGKDWKCLGNMESMLEWNFSDSYVRERSVICDSEFVERGGTKKKPRLVFDEEDYSWRTMQETKIKKGDYIVIGHFEAVDYIKSWISIKILQVTAITPCEEDGKGEIELKSFKEWSSFNFNNPDYSHGRNGYITSPKRDQDFNAFLGTLDPKLREVVDKSLQFEHDDKYWFFYDKDIKKKHEIVDGY